MFRPFSRVLRFPEGEAGATGATGTGATGTPPEGSPATEPQGEPKSLNSQAKELPWVKELIAFKAESERKSAEQAEAKLKEEGKFTEALGLKDNEIGELRSKNKMLELKAEFAAAGINDLRAVKLFIDDYDPETESAADFAARMKVDEKNAIYFTSPKQPRTPEPGTPAAGIGVGEKYDPSWINSDDPKKKAAAIEHNRKEFWKKHNGVSR